MNDAFAKQRGQDTFEEVVHQICELIQQGETVDIEGLAAAYPELAVQLRSLYPTLLAITSLEPASHEVELSLGNIDRRENETLGDFRILRQIGRGGMGVVYEAQQLTIDRKVALKILPLAALVDPRRCSGSKTKWLQSPRCNIRTLSRYIRLAKNAASTTSRCN